MEIRLTKRDGKLVASDHLSDEEMRTIANGEHFVAKITRPRNLGHHRKFFAMLGIVFDAQERYPTSEHLLDAVKVGMGLYDEVPLAKGKVLLKTRSISFGKMDQREFEQFYERAVLWIISRNGPLFGVQRPELEAQVLEFLS